MTSAAAPLALSDEYQKHFEAVMQILSDLPTEKAFRELSGMRSPAVRKVVETMALQKMDLVKSLRFMHYREELLRRMVANMMKGTPLADAGIQKFLTENPNYKIDLVAQ